MPKSEQRQTIRFRDTKQLHYCCDFIHFLLLQDDFGVHNNESLTAHPLSLQQRATYVFNGAGGQSLRADSTR